MRPIEFVAHVIAAIGAAAAEHHMITAALIGAAIWAMHDPCKVIGHQADPMMHIAKDGTSSWECRRCLQPFERKVSGKWKPEDEPRPQPRLSSLDSATSIEGSKKPNLRVVAHTQREVKAS